MTTQGSNDDCYFYFYSSCTKGDACPFRHCEAALGTETVCSLWRQGRCYRSNCKFRHMESRINRATIPCYWENQPGGCRKPHCVFLHKKLRSNIHDVAESQELILPVSANVTSTISKTPAKDQPTAKDQLKTSLTNAVSNEIASDLNNNGNENTSSQPIPFVVSFDEGEESDTESVSSTPVKSACFDSKVVHPDSAKVNLSSSLFEKESEKDFGVKTLEQLRMEKIHRESEHFYKSDDTTAKDIGSKTLEVNRNPLLNDAMFCYSAFDAPVIDSSHVVTPETVIYKQESYPPESEFISISIENPTDKSLPTAENSALPLSEHDRDLRGRLLKRRAMSSFPEKDIPAKRVISLRKEANVVEESLDFKIKTLDEIRKERESKQGNQEEATPMEVVKEKNSSQNVPTSSTDVISSASLTGIHKPLGRPKIKRQPKESYLRNNSVVNLSNGDMKYDTRSQMILHEVQNISDQDQSKCSKLNADEKCINITKASGKRKDIEFVTEKSSKVLKVDSSEIKSNTRKSVEVANEISKNVITDERLQRPIIRRNSVPLSQKNDSTKTVTSNVEDSSHDVLDIEYNEAELTLPEATSLKDGICSVTSTTSEEKESELRTVRSLSVDEFDHLFLTDGDVNLADVEDSTDGGAEELLLEFEQLLES